jgi:hypothetical protein
MLLFYHFTSSLGNIFNAGKLDEHYMIYVLMSSVWPMVRVQCEQS